MQRIRQEIEEEELKREADIREKVKKQLEETHRRELEGKVAQIRREEVRIRVGTCEWWSGRV